MKEIIFDINSNEEIWELIDKSVNNIFIHKFWPTEVIHWWKTDLKFETGLVLKDSLVRGMEFDLQTDLNGLKQILEMNTNQLRIYQFDKPVPDTLRLEHLPEDSKFKILKQNGLRHFFWVDFEFMTVSSFDDEFLKAIERNPLFSERIKQRNRGL
ncbi:hypothetical protein GU926_08915 [Nibribacter ruber]|uniref:Uncharacterized protein n=1 Tax=Nibribacter ruber TaxID=2698458 RepID=A0A6P1P1N6_9BACT|nr:hypothetical protein [Nibribacter ruber]QHL87552.1 hypothetical protein GU926_08915 [Nibribacter ruber]